MGEATSVADLPSLQEDKARAREAVVRDGSVIWERIRLRVEARLLVIERHAHRLLDRDLTDVEVAEATSAAGALAATLGQLELAVIARLGRHLVAVFQGDGLAAADAIHIAAATDDIRTLLESAIAQQDASANSRGTIVAIGEPSPDFDAVCWVLGVRGHGLVHDGNRLPHLDEEPAGVLVSLGDTFTDATATLLRAIDETWTAPVVALYRMDDESPPFRKIVEHCDVLLPSDATADTVGTELARAEAETSSRPSIVAHGRIPRPAIDLLRSYGFRIRRASTVDRVTEQLLREPAAVLFGLTANPTEVVAAARIVRAMPAIRNTSLFWLGEHDTEQRDAAHRHRIWPVDEVSDGLCVRLASLTRAVSGARAGVNDEDGTVLAWSAARVLTDRSLVAAHRSGAAVAVAVIHVDEEISDVRRAHIRETLGREFRRGDIIGERGDGSLIVILQGVNRKVATNRFADLLERLDLDGTDSGAGIAMFPNDGRSADELVQAAEAAQTMSSENDGPAVVSTAWRPVNQQTADVLIVEADPVLGKMLAAAVETRGMRTELLDTGTAALTRLTTQTDKAVPRLLLLDMDVPGLDGLSLVRRLRRAGVLAHVNVLLMTARSSESDLRTALDLGVSEVIRKPFSSSLLLHRLGRLLETS